MWAAFLRATAHTNIAVAERQDGFRLSKQIWMKTFFDDIPFIGWIVAERRSYALMPNHSDALRAVTGDGGSVSASAAAANCVSGIAHHSRRRPHRPAKVSPR